MIYALIRALFRAFGALPLRWSHRIGAVLGWLASYASAAHRRRTTENLQAFAHSRNLALDPSLLHAAFIEQGKGLAELALAWTAPVERIESLVQGCSNWALVDAAKAAGRPIIFVSPHLGCYDIAGRYVSNRLPLMALYRPPKQAWLDPLMQAGRARAGAAVARADAGGVRALLKMLHGGGNVMLLPDQVPAAEKGGEGVWAAFFGAPAYTMTLLPKLAQKTNAVVLYFFAERLVAARGYQIHIVPMSTPYSDDKQIAARQTNQMVETLIGMAPAQYLWSYNRYKRPAGAPLPPSSAKEVTP
jgi:Kdo2-lipid IVA lauroyltransferase/acyltransferase